MGSNVSSDDGAQQRRRLGDTTLNDIHTTLCPNTASATTMAYRTLALELVAFGNKIYEEGLRSLTTDELEQLAATLTRFAPRLLDAVYANVRCGYSHRWHFLGHRGHYASLSSEGENGRDREQDRKTVLRVSAASYLNAYGICAYPLRSALLHRHRVSPQSIVIVSSLVIETWWTIWHV